MIDSNANAIKCMEEEFMKVTKVKEVLEVAKDKEDNEKENSKTLTRCRY